MACGRRSRQVRTDAGAVRGGRYGGVAVFREIPFGEAPQGDLRFARPQPAPAWEGVLDCSSENALDMVQGFCPNLNVDGHVVGREDCLKLHVFRPDGTPAPGGRAPDKRPVYVYIHGGMFWTEDMVELTAHDPRRLAEDLGAVVVVMQYRLGVLGFFAAPSLMDEDDDGSTGNYGLQDQRLALEWVQRNAAAFGGDPDLVTIHGVSAGAMSICAHVASPASAGLFHRAIIQSGNCDNSYAFSPLATAEAVSESLSSRLGCGKDKQPGSAEQRECLRRLPLADLLKLQLYPVAKEHRDLLPLAPVLPWVPVVDGTRSGLLGTPQDRIAENDFNHVPILIGSTHNEGSLFAPELPALVRELRSPEAMVKEQLTSMFGATVTAQVLAEFPWMGKSKDPLWLKRLSEIITSYIFTCPARRTMRLMHSLGHQDIWQWHFQYNDHSLLYRLYGNYHTHESKFVFGPKWGEYKGEDREMQALMQGYWLNFALYGNPNGAEGRLRMEDDLHWDPASPDGVMLFQKESQMVDLVFPKHCDFWDRIAPA